MNNPFEPINARLNNLEALTLEVLQLLRSTATSSVTTDENPVSTDEAAKRFGIAKQTLYQNAKKIKHTKRFGRLYFYPSDIRAYLNAGESAANE
jgi:predicted DNA-binding protein (UPF0251 family)